MHYKLIKKYYFIDKFNKENIDKQDKNTSLIYRNYSKIINKHSVVSKEVCELMAISVKNLYNSDYSIATTGNAGPEKGESNAAIGKVFISVSSDNEIKTYELDFDGDRENIINNAVLKAFELLNDTI